MITWFIVCILRSQNYISCKKQKILRFFIIDIVIYIKANRTLMIKDKYINVRTKF